VKDKRKYERTSVEFRCWCEADDVTFYARVANLSDGGLFLRTSTPLKIGATARLRIAVGSSEVEAPVRVMWSRISEGQDPPGMGLQFEDMDPQSAERIRKIIASEKKSKRQAR
jgi:uncharacterized protein (TIGR02266 family)